MPARWGATALLAAAVTCEAYDTWHLVDVQAAVCPMPEDLPANITPPEFAIPIEYTSEVQQDKPYIFSFIRTSDKKMKITFSVKDADNNIVVDKTTVELKGLDGAKCACSGTTPIMQGGDVYPAGYGSKCQAWDQANCEKIAKDQGLEPGIWCCRPWCFVKDDCADSYTSSLKDTFFWSYGACRPETPTPITKDTCAYAEPDPCECIDASSIFDAAMNQKFNNTYGSRCNAWDYENCARDYEPHEVDSWCCDNWCYVSKDCPSAQKSLNNGMEDKLFWASKPCQQDPKLTSQCPYFPWFANATAADCTCLGEEMPASVLPTGAPTDYGKTCAAHNAEKCNEFFPSADKGMWCCDTWCWVSNKCEGSRESVVWPGHYFSSKGCDLTGQTAKDAITNCKAEYFSPGTNPCDCTGVSPTGVAAKYGTDLGKYCKAWDAADCEGFYPDSFKNTNESNVNDWCCDSWCYVQELCPFAEPSSLKPNFFYAMDVCPDTGPQKYDMDNDTCVDSRRLSSTVEEDDEVEVEGSIDSEDEVDGEGHWELRGRRLPSSRRRAPPAPRPPPAPATSSTRRRTPPPKQPAADNRRRAPAPPPPSLGTGSPRRRSSPQTTNMAASPRRRGMADNTAATARRRGVGNGQTPQYGYSQGNRNQMMNNYGGYPPQQTSYGYSGQTAPSGSRHNVAMAAAAGGAAGLAGGIGGAYLYNQYYDQYGYQGGSMIRRRRSHHSGWCIIPEGNARAGEFIECDDCRRQYGYAACESAEGCFHVSGCSYKIQKAANRDDLSATGFIPKNWKPPLKVKIESIEAADIITDGPQSICPPKNEEEAKEIEALSGAFNRTTVFQADLFVTITEQTLLSNSAGTGSGSGTTDVGGSVRQLPGVSLLGAVLLCLVAMRR